MKTILIGSIIISFIGCTKESSTICEGMTNTGISSFESLKGEWGFEKLACTTDGTKIKKTTELERGMLIFTDSVAEFRHSNTILYRTIRGNNNLLEFTMAGSTYVNPPCCEEDILSRVLTNAICFIINDNKLLIHFSKLNLEDEYFNQMDSKIKKGLEGKNIVELSRIH